MAIEVAHYLRNQEGVLVAASLGFENAYGFAMRRDETERLGLKTIADLNPIAGDLSVGGDPEFFARPEWESVRDTYGLDGMDTRGMDSTFMYQAVRDREVDVVGAYTTDGRIAAFDLAILDDPVGDQDQVGSGIARDSSAGSVVGGDHHQRFGTVSDLVSAYGRHRDLAHFGRW